MENILLKGTKDGFRLIVVPSATLGNVISEVEHKLDQSLDLFRAKGEVVMHIDAPSLSFCDKLKIQTLILEKHPSCVVSFDEIHCNITSSSVFHKGTLRAGQNIQSDAHLIVLGDVNPGAEITASGNIVVLGSLRGIVHAGCFGDRNASITALQLNPTQIRIADIITRSPDETIEIHQPEMAYIKDDRIYIDAIIKK